MKDTRSVTLGLCHMWHNCVCGIYSSMSRPRSARHGSMPVWLVGYAHELGDPFRDHDQSACWYWR